MIKRWFELPRRLGGNAAWRFSPRTYHPWQLKLHAVVLLVGIMVAGQSLAVVGWAQAATITAGYRDFSYGSVIAPTGQKPQSKLWYNDGIWWGSLFNRSEDQYAIYRFDWATQSWSDTGVIIDARLQSNADCLWDGVHLYVVSAVPPGTTGDVGARVLRYSYNSANKTYSLDAGFPVTLFDAGVETIVLDKDSTGKLWVTYTGDDGAGGRKVYVAHSSNGRDSRWTAPYVLPVAGAANLTGDDISSLVAYNAKIGVAWSNQNDNAMYFAFHQDDVADTEWTVYSMLQGSKYADDHLNLKSLQADASGQVFAAVKTSLNDVNPPTSSKPLILLLSLGQSGGWSRRTVWQVKDAPTRPLVLLDNQNRQIYVFATIQFGGQASGAIYYKQISLDNSSAQFPEGLGTPFIINSADIHINNATSTKQPLNSTTNLLVLAGDDTSKYYLHNIIDLGAALPPETAIDSGPSGTVSSSAASFSFSANEAGSTFACSLDGAAFSACSSPQSYSSLADGAHTFQVRATDAAGNTDPTPASQTWTIDTTPPQTAIDAGPSGTVSSSAASFSFSASEAGSTFACSLDGAAFSACSSPRSYSNLADGTHTFQVRATDPAGNTDPTPASQTWTIDTTPPSITVITPVSGALIDGKVRIVAAASDNRGDVKVRFYVDDTLIGADTAAPYEMVWDIPKNVIGSHRLSAEAQDSAGNIRRSSSITINISKPGTRVFFPLVRHI